MKGKLYLGTGLGYHTNEQVCQISKLMGISVDRIIVTDDDRANNTIFSVDTQGAILNIQANEDNANDIYINNMDKWQYFLNANIEEDSRLIYTSSSLRDENDHPINLNSTAYQLSLLKALSENRESRVDIASLNYVTVMANGALVRSDVGDFRKGIMSNMMDYNGRVILTDLAPSNYNAVVTICGSVVDSVYVNFDLSIGFLGSETTVGSMAFVADNDLSKVNPYNLRMGVSFQALSDIPESTFKVINAAVTSIVSALGIENGVFTSKIFIDVDENLEINDNKFWYDSTNLRFDNTSFSLSMTHMNYLDNTITNSGFERG